MHLPSVDESTVKVVDDTVASDDETFSVVDFRSIAKAKIRFIPIWFYKISPNPLTLDLCLTVQHRMTIPYGI